MAQDSLGNQKKSWQLVKYALNNKMGSKDSKLPPTIIKENGDILTEPKEIADEHSRYFSQVSQKLRMELDEFYCGRPRMKTFPSDPVEHSQYVPMTVTDLTHITQSFKTNSARGADGISASMMKMMT